MKTVFKRECNIRNDVASESLSLIDKQRRMAFTYAGVSLLVADISLWFLGMALVGRPAWEAVHPVHFVITATMLVMYLRGRLSATTGVTILCSVNQLALLLEIWSCLTVRPPMWAGLIMAYMIMAVLNMALVALAYIRVLPFVFGIITAASYGVCCIVGGDEMLMWLLVIVMPCFAVIAAGGHHMSASAYRLEREKEVLRTNEQQILNMLELDKSQLTACIALARDKGLTSEQTGTLLDLIGKKARDNIRDNVAYYFRQRAIDYARLEELLPRLTSSEIKICDLILKEKRLKDIVRILDTSEGNVTSQRANIRRKLGLTPADNLRDTLLKITDRE